MPDRREGCTLEQIREMIAALEDDIKRHDENLKTCSLEKDQRDQAMLEVFERHLAKEHLEKQETNAKLDKLFTQYDEWQAMVMQGRGGIRVLLGLGVAVPGLWALLSWVNNHIKF